MKGWLFVVAGLLSTGSIGCTSAPPRPAGDFCRGTPEEQGVSSAAILSFLEAADRIDAMNSLMIVRHGRVIAEGWWAPYEAGSNHELYSLSKSFTSTAVGLAIAEGKLTLDDEVLTFFPGDAPPSPSANLKAMRVRDLLTMSAGHQDETSSAADTITAKSFLAHPVPHKPGTHFRYNTPATFMLSAIVQKVTGQTVLEYLRPRLFEPLGITQPVWNTNAQGISLGGYGLRVRTEDIARFGQLYLQRGRWQGKQVIPEAWVDLATSRQVSNGSNPKSDWDQGYGFQFWRCRHGAYRGDGAFGQYCIVLPGQDAVIAITSGLKDMQAVLNLVWDRLLPGFQEEALPGDAAGVARLRERLAGLRVRVVEGGATSTEAARIGGKRFLFPANDQKLEWIVLRPDPAGKKTEVALRVNGADRTIACGYREWVKGRGSFDTHADEPMAASGAWVKEDTFVMKQCFTETPFALTTTLRYLGGEVSCTMEMNVGFGATKKPTLTGKAE
jgi:CubicO group peptidase (beta-lactamase class C family)